MKFVLAVMVLCLVSQDTWGQHVGDFDDDGQVGYADFLGFMQAYGADDMRADLNADGFISFADFVFLASIYQQPPFRRTNSGIWLSTRRGYHYEIDEYDNKRKVVSEDSLSLYVGCPPEYDGEPTLIFHRHEGNAGTPQEWYVGVQFFVLTIWASRDDPNYASLKQQLLERYDYRNKFVWARKEGAFFIANRTIHRDDLQPQWRPVCEVIANADGSITFTCEGEEKIPMTPEWVPQFIDMLRDPLVKDIQMPFWSPLSPSSLIHNPDTIYDSASYTHWDITPVIKGELRRVQRRCDRQSGADVF